MCDFNSKITVDPQANLKNWLDLDEFNQRLGVFSPSGVTPHPDTISARPPPGFEILRDFGSGLMRTGRDDGGGTATIHARACENW